jgi:hypothetical protein
VLIIPAGVVGGLLWARDAQSPFWIASLIGAVGVAYFMITFHRPPSTAPRAA